MEHLQDFICYAYIFYTGPLESPTLVSFKSGWREALGNIAWYRMVVAAMVNDGGRGQGGLTIMVVSEAAVWSLDLNESFINKSGSAKSISYAPAAPRLQPPLTALASIYVQCMLEFLELYNISHTKTLKKSSSIQQRAILLITQGRDVITQAQSGTGKTATFYIAILQSIDITILDAQALFLSPGISNSVSHSRFG